MNGPIQLRDAADLDVSTIREIRRRLERQGDAEFTRHNIMTFLDAIERHCIDSGGGWIWRVRHMIDTAK